MGGGMIDDVVCVDCKRPLPAAQFALGFLTSKSSLVRPRCDECMSQRIRKVLIARGFDPDERDRLAARGEKRCSHCKEVKPLEFFTTKNGNVRHRCHACNLQMERDRKAGLSPEEVERLAARNKRRCWEYHAAKKTPHNVREKRTRG